MVATPPAIDGAPQVFRRRRTGKGFTRPALCTAGHAVPTPLLDYGAGFPRGSAEALLIFDLPELKPHMVTRTCSLFRRYVFLTGSVEVETREPLRRESMSDRFRV